MKHTNEEYEEKNLIYAQWYFQKCFKKFEYFQISIGQTTV